MRRSLAALVLILLPTLARAGEVPLPRSRPAAVLVNDRFDSLRAPAPLTDQQVLQRYARFNDECRGGNGDERKTMHACAMRDKIYAVELERRGWCFGPSELPMYQQQWLPCRQIKMSAPTASPGAPLREERPQSEAVPSAKLKQLIGELIRANGYLCPEVRSIIGMGAAADGHVFSVGCNVSGHVGTRFRFVWDGQSLFSYRVRPSN